MNKKENIVVLGLMLLFGTLPAFSNDWGIFKDYPKEYNTKRSLSSIIDTGKVTYSLTEEGVEKSKSGISTSKDPNLPVSKSLENDIVNKAEKERREKELEDMVYESFRVWFDDTKATIRKSARTEEFNDIKNILDRSVKAIRVKDKNAQGARKPIKILFTTRKKMKNICCTESQEKAGLSCEYTEGCTDGEMIALVNPYLEKDMKERVKAALIHEIGHCYGLTDQYTNLGDSSISRSTNDRFVEGTSVMAADLDTHLKCDDVDGFINLIDYTQYLKNKKWSPRAKKEGGWASFCNGKKINNDPNDEYYSDVFYKEARVLNRENYVDNGVEGDGCVYIYDQDGKPYKKYCPKIWNFANGEMKKLSKRQDGVITGKEDSKFRYIYDYKIEGNEPTISIYVAHEDKHKNYVSDRIFLKDKYFWKLTKGDYVAGGYIYTDKKECLIIDYNPFSDEKYSFVFKNNKLVKANKRNMKEEVLDSALALCDYFREVDIYFERLERGDFANKLPSLPHKKKTN